MKKLNILLAAFGLAGMAQMASAQTTITLTGSTAFRASTHSAILAVLDGEDWGVNGANASTASRGYYRGNLGVGGPLVRIRTSWSGSAAGVQAVSDSVAVQVYPSTTAMDNILTQDTDNNLVGESGLPSFVNEVPDVALSDVFQASTSFNTNALVEEAIAVVPFRFFASAGSSLTNITPQLFRALYSGGALPMAVFTGNTADESKFVYAYGRANDSGTRITVLAETGYGINIQVQQFQTISDAGLTATVTGSTDNAGVSGSTLAGFLRNDYSPDAIVSYLGNSDATTALAAADANGAPAVVLQYNGATFSNDNIYNGVYTLWGYQVISNRGTLGTVAQQAYDAIRDQIIANPGSAGLSLNDMRVARDSDGGVVGPVY